ncbi:hypothetical protein AAFC00_003039 [Neodothiora populina]|uniref:G-patch domain-containing protein n=1 Tax=Neodothiora populina TaxID=2781224 RepID=A0ABR3P9B9_9PEZI
MNASALLQKQGWRGAGHSLDASNTGLKKPLLISKKIDVLGIGINKHDVVADQWWMKAFDSSLKDFGTGKKSLLGNVRELGVSRGGLYGRFVRGEGVPGTFSELKEEKKTEETERQAKKKGKKRKVDDDGAEDKAARKEKKKARKSKSASVSASAATTDSESSSKKDKKDKKTKTKKEKEPKTLDALDETKRKEYTARAAEKDLSLEVYFVKRQAKNLAARSGNKG